MSLRALYLYMSSDIQSLNTATATSVQALNPQLFPLIASVPEYCYKPLGTMLVGVNCTSGELARHIVYKEGQGLENSSAEITLCGAPFESNYIREGIQSNEIGAETMRIDVIIRHPQDKGDWNTLVNIDCRIKYLLDYGWRQKRRVQAMVPNLGDFSLDGGLMCKFEHAPDPPNAQEMVSRYWISYTRAVPR